MLTSNAPLHLHHCCAAHLSPGCSFTAMPLAHTTYLQLTDLAESDAAISQLVAGAPLPASTPSEAYGWFTFSSSQQLQQALSMAFSSIHRQQLGELQEQLARMPQQQDGQEAAGELWLPLLGCCPNRQCPTYFVGALAMCRCMSRQCMASQVPTTRMLSS